jgi:aldose 1-epimerase
MQINKRKDNQMEPGIKSQFFGSQHTLYTLTHGELQVQVTDYGATLVSVYTPDSEGRLANIVLGFDNIEGYLGNHPYLGSIVGPYANRIGHSSFVIDGTEYKIEPNDGTHLLHSGGAGFSRRKWHGERSRGGNPSVTFTLETNRGEGGFPGSMLVTVTYTLTENELEIAYRAETDEATPCNLTSHPYWNLKGAGQGNILEHVLQIFGDCYTPTDEALIPTGQILGVQGTGLNFTQPRLIQASMFSDEGVAVGGYDVNFVLRGGADGDIAQAAILRERTSGRQLEIWTTQPGLQLYTGHGLDGTLSGANRTFPKYGGVCLEAQNWPDAVNHDNFPNAILRSGEPYQHTTLHRFSVVH